MARARSKDKSNLKKAGVAKKRRKIGRTGGRARSKRRKLTPGYVRDLDPGCDTETEELLAAGKISHAAASIASAMVAVSSGVIPAQPKAVPANDPVPFAESSAAPQARHWPVKTNHASRNVVSYETMDGKIQGAPGRRFLAQRNAGTRFHVGIDLFANPSDEVVACEDGKIVAFYNFYKSSAGEMTYALLIEHAGFVVNYGEVKGDSPTRFHWKVGDTVTGGQSIARVSSTSMTHFETYRRGTRRNQHWFPGKRRPAALLNPTAYLLGLLSV